MSEVWHKLQIWQGRCYWLLTVYVPGVWGQKVPIKQWKAIQRWKNASHQYWIRNNYDESIMDTRLEAQLVKNLRKGKGNPHLSVCSASSLAWFLELCTIGLQRTCSTCSSQKKEEIDFARAALSRIQKGVWNKKSAVIVSVTRSSRHLWVAPDQSLGSSGHSLHWLPCLKASGLCDIGDVVIMTTIDSGFSNLCMIPAEWMYLRPLMIW